MARTTHFIRTLLCAGLLLACAPLAAEPATRLVTLSFRDAPIQEVFEMLSRNEHINILLGKGVTGSISVNLYDVGVPQAVQAIADAAGYVAERRGDSYVIMERTQAGMDAVNANTLMRTFKVQYSNPKAVAEILTKHLSRYGRITALGERNMIVVEDLPDFVERIRKLLAELDVQPRQILIEAKILEITLDRNESFGIDWNKIFSASGNSRFGTTGLASPPGTPGFFFSLVNDNIDLFLTALSGKGRVQALSTPKLLALENHEASTVIGDRTGYKVTTTVNQVTTESIEFLETGVILKVTPSVDEHNRILLKIHPEVSSASIAPSGIPSKKSTEVTTQLLAEDGQAIFIGGLIKRNSDYKRSGVPLLSDIPMLGAAFSSTTDTLSNTETVILITPHIVKEAAVPEPLALKVEQADSLMLKASREVEQTLLRRRPEGSE